MKLVPRRHKSRILLAICLAVLLRKAKKEKMLKI
jgi:hypothetical protein